MFKELKPDDIALNGEMFRQEEVAYNLLHCIADGETAIRLKSIDGLLMMAQTNGFNGWLWIAKDLSDEEKRERIEALVQHLQGSSLPGISGDPEIAKLFAQSYAARNSLRHETVMIMEAYECISVNKPPKTNGVVKKADLEHVMIVADLMARMAEESFGVPILVDSQRPEAERVIEAGHCFLWIIEEEPVSLANIAHLSPRHGRINAVYTPPKHRKKGYASAVVAEASSHLLAEGINPMLYADISNPNSNGVYRSLGFQERGKIADYRFS
jgi:uncharacterized protein